ncbi:MAG: hypothetical protein E7568_05625 [Ruminococcaceae bacterium]|nr:hypothetical protein [Oscillospiraceae bacterium]
MAKVVMQDTKVKKEFLESYLKIMEAVSDLKEELKDWQELAVGKPKESFYTANIISKQREIVKLEDKAVTAKISILKATDEIEDKRIRNVLRRHYIHGQSIKQISKVTYYSERYVKRLHKKGVEVINLTTP